MFTPSIIGSGLAGYRFLQSTKDTQMRTFENSPEVANDMTRFKERIASIQTVDELMDDRALLRVALGAFGLDEDINNTVFIRRVLESDLSDPASTANRLSDKRYLALAKTFNFGGTDGANLPGASAAELVAKELQALDSVDALFRDTALLDRMLKAFDLEQYKDQTVFLKTVLTSDLDDETSLPFRLSDPKFLAAARAFQGVELRLSPTLLANVSQDVATKLQGLGSSDDLVDDRILLRAVLSVYGLESETNNSFFIKQVLDSDLSDPTSFANSLRDPRYAELAAAFGFQELSASEGSIYAYVDLLESKLDGLYTADDLLGDAELLEATLEIYGLPNADADMVLLKDILESDLTDPLSEANQQTDERYKALAAAFGFQEIAAADAAHVAGGGTVDAAKRAEFKQDAQDTLFDLVEEVGGLRKPLTDAPAFTGDLGVMLAVTEFFGVPMGSRTGYSLRVIEAYGSDPDATYLPRTDMRYKTLYDAMDFNPAPEGRTYPAGFADAVTEMFLERQFEIKVGEVDSDLRLALSLERELTDAVNRVSTDDARWYTVLASQPLRAVFESAFGLPTSFAQLDLDRQVADLRTKTEQAFGTSEVEKLLDPEIIGQLRQRYLTSLGSTAVNPAVSLLANASSSGSSGTSLVNLLF